MRKALGGWYSIELTVRVENRRRGLAKGCMGLCQEVKFEGGLEGNSELHPAERCCTYPLEMSRMQNTFST